MKLIYILSLIIATIALPDAPYDLTQSLPTGYVKDGSVDYTDALQAGLAKNDYVTFPAFPVLINDKGLSLHSNQKVVFVKGSELWLKPSDKGSYDMLSVKGCSNVSILYAVIKGDRKTHKGTSGEWGNGIGIYSSTNVSVISPMITNTWGDGVYVGGGSSPSRNITLSKLNIGYARRNAVSITSAIDVQVNDSYLHHTKGTLPEDGIDIEPNYPTDEIQNIRINNLFTSCNAGYGVEFSLSLMYGGGEKYVNASVINHKDSASKSGAYISCYPKKSGKVTGTINFINPIWKNYLDLAWRPYGSQEPGLSVVVNNPVVVSKKGEVKQGSAEYFHDVTHEIYPGSNTKINYDK